MAGDVPQAYLDLIERTKANIVTANVQVSITPELQAVIDEAKAECAKVVAENVELKEQIETLKTDLVPGEPADLSGLISVEQFDAVAQKLVEAEEKLEQSHGELIASQSENTELKAKIAELEAKPKKPTAAEIKATKAAEEAKTAEPPKE